MFFTALNDKIKVYIICEIVSMFLHPRMWSVYQNDSYKILSKNLIVKCCQLEFRVACNNMNSKNSMKSSHVEMDFDIIC